MIIHKNDNYADFPRNPFHCIEIVPHRKSEEQLEKSMTFQRMWAD